MTKNAEGLLLCLSLSKKLLQKAKSRKEVLSDKQKGDSNYEKVWIHKKFALPLVYDVVSQIQDIFETRPKISKDCRSQTDVSWYFTAEEIEKWVKKTKREVLALLEGSEGKKQP